MVCFATQDKAQVENTDHKIAFQSKTLIKLHRSFTLKIMPKKLVCFLYVVSACVLISGLSEACARKVQPRRPSKERTVEENKVYCKDEEGNPISWFMAYKLGRIRESTYDRIREGVGYVTLRPGEDKWSISNKRIDDPSSILRQTIKTLWVKTTPRNQLFILYSDQPPSRNAVSYNGHMKGIIIAQANGGIWIQHSLPKFPERNANFLYPENGDNNAQLFYCMTLTRKNLDEIVGKALIHAKPVVYDSYIPKNLETLYPTLVNLTDKKPKRNRDTKVMLQLVDKDINMTIFAKGPKFEKEIYSDWIAPTLETGLKVQSWLNGANSLPSNCAPKKYQILNISDKQLYEQKFSTRKDHSKWAISHTSGWTCISDLNRMDSQKLRGGTSLCTSNSKIWQSFENAILDVQPCPKPS